jgi:hypothetical protein
MEYRNGQLVRHPKWGLGKVLKVAGDKVTVFFKEEATNPKTISTTAFPLQIVKDETDPWLRHLDVSVAESGAVRQYLTHQAAIDKFVRIFPSGFYDAKYLGDARSGERNYKWAAHELWNQALSRAEFEHLLKTGQFREATDRALRVESKTNLLATFEKAALRDAVRDEGPAKDFSLALFDLIYGTDPFQARFNRFSTVLDTLPQPKSALLKWPVQTLFPFLACPNEHLFLKPEVTKKAAERRAFALNYKPTPNWLTYSCLLQFGQLLMRDLADLKPRDMIDIQSLIWVTGSDSY